MLVVPLNTRVGAEEFEKAIAATKFGIFNIILILIAVPGTAAIIFESTTMSFIFTAAESDLALAATHKGLLNSITYAGMIVSAIPWAILSDTRGRKLVLVSAHLLDAVFVLLSACSQSFPQLILCKFFGGICICGGFPTLMTYLAEMHGKEYRLRIIFLTGILLTMATLMLPVLAVLILPRKMDFNIGSLKFHAWNIYLAICAIPSTLCGICSMLLPESAKYKLRQHRVSEAYVIFQKIYAINTGKPETEYPFEITGLTKYGIAQEKRFSFIEIARDGWEQLQPLFSKEYMLTAMNVCSIDFLVLMCQNTLRLWMPQLFASAEAYAHTHGNKAANICTILEMNLQVHDKQQLHICAKSFTNNFIVGGASIIAFTLAFIFINKVGAKIVLSVSLAMSSAAGFSLYLGTNTFNIVLISSIYLSVENISGTSVVNACVGLFPTEMRNTIVAMAMMLGRIGSVFGNVLFPYLMKSGCLPPILWLGIVGTVAFFLSLPLANPSTVVFQ